MILKSLAILTCAYVARLQTCVLYGVLIAMGLFAWQFSGPVCGISVVVGLLIFRWAALIIIHLPLVCFRDMTLLVDGTGHSEQTLDIYHKECGSGQVSWGIDEMRCLKCHKTVGFWLSYAEFMQTFFATLNDGRPRVVKAYFVRLRTTVVVQRKTTAKK